MIIQGPPGIPGTILMAKYQYQSHNLMELILYRSLAINLAEQENATVTFQKYQNLFTQKEIIIKKTFKHSN